MMMAGVHPALKARVQLILNVAARHGGDYRVSSGLRSREQQDSLFCSPNPFPVARPGCSQHEYGFAVDVVFSRQDWQRWYLAVGGLLGLSTVPNDPVHLQLFPSAIWSRAMRRYPPCRESRPSCVPQKPSGETILEQFARFLRSSGTYLKDIII